MVTVTIANVDQLVKYYRVLALKLEMVNSSDNSTIDINESGAADSNDWVLLTLDNASVSMFTYGTDNTTVRIVSGYYVSNVYSQGWQSDAAQPSLYAEVAASGIPSHTGTPNQYALIVSTSGQGSVNQNPYQTSYADGTIVTLTAIPAPGWSFDHWSGDLTGNSNPTTIMMTGNKTVTASFAINTYTITASAGTHGSISPSGAVTVNDGADQAFTITANSGYHIADVLVDGSSVGAVTSYTFHNVTADHTIAASFAITGPAITVTSPNGGESWAVGSTQTITWTSVGITGNVMIQLSRNGGITWTTIISSTRNDGSQAWKVTGPATTQARIKIVSVSTPTIFDISDANFTIIH